MSSIRSNRAYNNPQIGAAFDSIAQMFAPPSAQDTYAYAKAKSEREAAGRLSDLYANPNDPMASSRAALLGLQDYSNTPAGFATSTETLRRGQDIGSADARYGSDRTYAATTENNIRDNDRAVRTNAADNARTLQTTQLSELGKFFAPLNEGQIRPAVPPSISQHYGIDEALPQAEGRQKALTTDEFTANALGALRAAGHLPDEDIRRRYLGSGQKPDLENWIGPNGAGGGTAIFDNAAGQWRDTSTRQPLPAGSRTYSGQLQGSAEATGLGPTTSNATEATRLESSLDQAQALVGNIRTILRENQNVAGIPGRLKGVVQSLTSSAQQVVGAYAQAAPDAALSIDEARQLLQKELGPTFENYDPNVVRVQSMVYDLAYARAQMANPSGEVSRQAFERALEAMGQGYLSSQTDLATALDAFEQDTIGAGRVRVNSLRGQRPDTRGAAPSAAPQPGAPAERWERGPDGKLRRAQ